ncbi:MAG: alpha/beta hydrolase [Acidimicrobiia bacterium]|nr:alpha/beta hydrolase [Acidimicrobiia bacterium]
MTAAGFVGVHPEGLGDLARHCGETSHQIRRLGGTVDGLLARHRHAAAADIIRLLLAVAAAVAEAADSLEWRAAAIASPVALSPTRVHAVFSRLVPSVATELTDKFPSIVGQLDGVPPHLRYRANQILIERHIGDLEAELDRLGEAKSPGRADRIDPHRLLSTHLLRLQVSEYRRWLAEERQILLFDPRGDGRVIEVFGDLESAEHIAVVVPGITNDKTNFSSAADGGFRSNASVLYAAAAAINPDTATIAWLGYDPPDGIDAGLPGAALLGAPALQRFVAGIDPQTQSDVTVVAHSYGSLVAGLAAAGGLAADDLVFLGSPGTGLDHSSEARLRPPGRVWVGLADGDPIAVTPFPSILPLWRGANPANHGFGAARFSTEGSFGHSAYFEADSLANLVTIVQGRYGDVALIR